MEFARIIRFYELSEMCLEKMTLFSPAKVAVGSIIPEKITLNLLKPEFYI